MKIIYLIFSILVIKQSIANYEMIYPMKEFNIEFKKNNVEEPTPEIIYGEWVNFNNQYNCTDYSPLNNTISIGVQFQQTQECYQDQVRTVTNSNINEEYRTINVVNSKNEIGTLDCKYYNIGIYGFGSYGSQSNNTGIIENPNNGTRISWNAVLIYSDLNQTKKTDKSFIDLNGYRYIRKELTNNRNINFEGYNYKSYDHSICRHPI